MLSGDPPWPSGYNAWLAKVCSQIGVSTESSSGLTWSLCISAATWWAVFSPSATERLYLTIRKEKGIFFPVPGFYHVAI